MSADIIGRDRMIVVGGAFREDKSHRVTSQVRKELGSIRPDIAWDVRYEITSENGPEQVAQAVGLRVRAILEATK